MSPEVASVIGAVIAFGGGVVAAILTYISARRNADNTRLQADNTLAGAQHTATATLRSAELAAENVMQPAAYGDRARWQMHKREVYSRLIEAMHREDSTIFREKASLARLVANSNLRARLLPYANGSSNVPEAEERESLVEALREDANEPHAAD
jgi:hypothetical protein